LLSRACGIYRTAYHRFEEHGQAVAAFIPSLSMRGHIGVPKDKEASGLSPISQKYVLNPRDLETPKTQLNPDTIAEAFF
jgi:hypothetical protein